MTGPYNKGQEAQKEDGLVKTHTDAGEGHVQMKAENRMIHLQAKDRPQGPETRKRQGTESPSEPPKRNQAS